MTFCRKIRSCVFVFQAEDGIRDLVRSRGLGDVYKRQKVCSQSDVVITTAQLFGRKAPIVVTKDMIAQMKALSLIHI